MEAQFEAYHKGSYMSVGTRTSGNTPIGSVFATNSPAHAAAVAHLYIRLPLRMKLEIFWVVVAVA